jgi:aspartate/methionine/tyrosine aminotransferase
VSLADDLNRDLREGAPVLAAALSDLGRRTAFPPDIPVQSAEARGKELNATIGQVTDGAGAPLAPAALRAVFAGLEPAQTDRAILYSAVEGIAELRRLWSARLARGSSGPFTLPQVTVGLTHGLSLLADLFAGPDRPVAVATPFWGNYRQVFALRRGARMVTGPAYRDGRFNTDAIVEALAGEPPGRPAVAILNFPSNPGGYSPTVEERRQLVRGLVEEADQRPLVVILDDGYAALVYEEGVPADSLFWELADRHPNLTPIKVDGATKELSFFGGRVGFLTFALPPEGEAAAALESKLKCLLRATLGSPPAASQVALIRALSDEAIQRQVEAIRERLAARYRVLAGALSEVDRSLLEPLPFNSGCFALVELKKSLGLDSNDVRRELLERYDTGLIAIAPDYLRIAFCSVRQAALPELVGRLEAAVRGLAGRAGATAAP